jgi:peptidyl-prolyl cis-trans isomerase D
VLGQRKISAPIALGDDRFVILKVRAHTKAAVPPLASVREKVVAAVQRERAKEAARAAAEAAAARVDSVATFDNAVRALGVVSEPARFVDRRDPALPSTVRNALFTFPRPVGGKPVTRAVPLPEGGYAVVTFTQSRTMPAAGDAQLRGFRVQQITAGQGQASVGAYVEELRRSAKVEKNPRAFQ